MSVALYMDVRVPAAVTRGLLLRNVDVLTGITIGRFINDLELLAQSGYAGDYANRVEYLPL